MLHKWRSFFTTSFFWFNFILNLKYFGIQVVVFHNHNLFDCLIVSVPSMLCFTILVEHLFVRWKLKAYVALNIVLTAFMVSLMIYFKQFGIIVTYHAFKQAKQVADLGNSILELFEPLYLLYYADIIAYFMLKYFRVDQKFTALHNSFKPLAALWVISVGTLIGYAYSYDHLLNEFKQAERMGLVGYEIHTFVSSMTTQTTVAAVEQITPESIRSVKGLTYATNPQYFGDAQGKNLIVVQLESFQNFLIGSSIEGKEITPTLNELTKESFYFSNVYQNISQGNTSDAEFIVNTAFYPPAQQAASQAYGSKNIPSLPRFLSKQGYESITLHTNDVDFWNRVQLYPALGFNRYYEKTWFGDEDVIAFGASDEVLYNKTIPLLTELRDKGQPFYAHVIAQSSHHPFAPVEHKQMLSLPEMWDDTLIGNYLKLANYADRALGKFIEQLKAEGLWENTILVIYGDHFGISPHSIPEEEKDMLEGLLGHEYTMRVVHNIPFLITVPGLTPEGLEISNTGGQVDIMPTIANLLGISLLEEIYFGQDLLNHKKNIIGSRFYLPTGSFLNNEIMYISGATFGDGTIIPLMNNHNVLDTNPMRYKDDFVRIMLIMQMNDAYLESLPERR
jgi:lipoteichoic acid synthase